MIRTAMLTLAAATGLALLTACDALPRMLDQRPTARLLAARVQQMDLQQASLAFDVEVSNPYAAALPLTALRYALSSNGASIARGDAQPSVRSIPANGKATLTLPVTLTYADVLQAVQGLRPGVMLPYEAELSLIAQPPLAGELPLTLRKSGQLPVPAAPRVVLNELVWKELSLQRASGVLDLGVLNTNQFPVELGKLGADLLLGGRRVASVQQASKLSLKPQETGGLRVPFEVSPAALGAQLLAMLAGGEVSYSLNGKAEATTPAGPLTWPFEASGKAAHTRKP